MMRRIDDEIQLLLKEHNGNIRQALSGNERLDYLYALSDQRETLLEWYDFDPEGTLLQVGADYGAMTGLFRQSVAEVTVLDEDANALETVKLRYPMARNIRLKQSTLAGYAAGLPQPEHLGGMDGQDGRGQADLYNYVVFAGTLRAPYEENIRAAKSLLKPDGVLIVAAANSLAMKYWAGSAREENALSKKKLLELLSEENTHFYYPMPDYRTPVSY